MKNLNILLFYLVFMGKIFNDFNKNLYKNEAEVENNFVIPLLTGYLGFHRKNIIHKSRFSSIPNFPKDYPINRNVKKILDGQIEPDYVIKNEEGDFQLIVEAKGPNERLDKYENQYGAYCAALRVNLILTTNGSQLYLYDLFEIIIACNNLMEIDQKLEDIKSLIQRENLGKDLVPRIKKLKYYENSKTLPKLIISDFYPYIEERIEIEDRIRVLDQSLNEFIDFRSYKLFINRNYLNLKTFFEKIVYSKENLFFLEGNAGTGKSIFSDYIVNHFKQESKSVKDSLIPIKVELKHWTPKVDILDIILEITNIDHLTDNYIRRCLSEGLFIFIFDSYDELDFDFRSHFHRELLKIKEMYKKNKSLVLIRPGTKVLNLTTSERLITLTPPSLESMLEYLDSNLNNDGENFIQEITEKNLGGFVKTPIFLNYTIIYKRKFKKLPNSKLVLIKELVNQYFSDYISKKIGKNYDYYYIETILKSIAFQMLYDLNVYSIKENLFMEFLQSLSNEKNTSINEFDEIIDFLIKYNIIQFKNSLYSFNHQILLEYFCSLALLEKIDRKEMDYTKEDIFHRNSIHNSIVLIFLKLQKTEFRKLIEEKNCFLFIESLLEKSFLTDSEKSFIQKTLRSRSNSQFADIRWISWSLTRKYCFIVQNPEDFIFSILKVNKNRDILSWALQFLGVLNTEKSRQFLLDFKDKDEKISYKDPVFSSLVIAISYFDEQIVQDKLISYLKSNWLGILVYLDIETALLNIAKRGKLTTKSFSDIIEIYRIPPIFDIELKVDQQKAEIRSHLVKVILEFNDQSLFQDFLQLLEDEIDDVLSRYLTIEILSNILSEKNLEILFNKIKSSEIDTKFKGFLSLIISESSFNIEYENLYSILRYVTNNYPMDNIPIIEPEFSNYLGDNPDINHYYFIFDNILDFIIEKSHNVKYMNHDQLTSFLRPFLQYPLTQKKCVKYFLKFKTSELNIDLHIFNIDSLILYIKSLFQINNAKAIHYCKEFTKKFMNNPFFSLSIPMNLLIDHNEKKIAQDLFEDFFNLDINFSTLNYYSFSFITKFEKDYRIKVIKYFIMKIKLESEKKFTNFFTFFEVIGSIDDDEYVDTILQVINDYSTEEYLTERLFRILIDINPIRYEDQILKILNNKLFKTKGLWRALNLLAFIGTDKSISFSKRFINDPNDSIKQMAFYCIKTIYLKNNIDWYDNEERLETSSSLEHKNYQN